MDSVSGWMKEKRIEAGLNVKELAFVAGTNHAQISRLETGNMGLTMNFLVVLLWALKIDASEFTAQFALPPVELPDSSSSENLAPINVDSEEAISQIENIIDPGTVFQFLKTYENDVSSAITFFTRTLGAAIAKADLSDSRLGDLHGTLKNAIYSGRLLPNPPGLTMEMLSHWYSKGAIMTLADAGVYLRLWREQQGHSLEKLASLSEMSKSTISRIENGQGDRPLLHDIANLDKALQANGKVFSMYWLVSMRQMGIWHSMKDAKRQPLSPQNGNLADTLIKVARWSHLYDQPNTPWIEPWLGEMIETENPVAAFNAYLRGDKHDYLALSKEICEAFPSKFFMYEEGEYPEEVTPELDWGIQLWTALQTAIGDDAFGKQMLILFRKNFGDPDYITAFRVLLRELMMANPAFLEKVLELLGKKDDNQIQGL